MNLIGILFVLPPLLSSVTDSRGEVVALQKDGKIVVAGTVSKKNRQSLFAARFESDGSPGGTIQKNQTVLLPALTGRERSILHLVIRVLLL